MPVPRTPSPPAPPEHQRQHQREHRREPWPELVVDALATYRLVKLVRDDRITEPARDAVIDKHGPPATSKVSYLLQCPWCLSFYFGAALTLGRRFLPGPTRGVARTFALSALAGIGTRLLDD